MNLYEQINSEVQGALTDHPLMILGVILGLYLFGGDGVRKVMEYAVSSVISLLKRLFTSGKQAVLENAASNTDLKGPFDALQTVTKWAVKESTPEVLAKVTGLYQDLQALEQKKEPK